ncbi:hypothetical protein HELRODRAFT_127849, partial [Helobdella robusta]|uniref:Transcription factor CBF/NF-Y/archaeal histone domain-containing protein n=1 Tax=Helobdella robusta TaxID=6412 RepID=T1EHI7_HELRO
DKIVRLPLTRIKTIIKTDSDVNLVSHDAVLLITKATELFIESLAEQAYENTAQAKRKTVYKRDIDLAIENIESLAFLEGVFD